MECTGPAACGSGQAFRYVHSSAYATVQASHEAAMRTHDPHAVADILARHPWHVDSLLALSDVYRTMGEAQSAAELLEQALFALEGAWHPWFNPTLGSCRLPYSEAANRPLFHALFRHAQALGRRGCHRTALEVCKLLLALDGDDPLGALFCIDYYALRAEQYRWLEAIASSSYGVDHSLALFPNYSYNLALARFRLEEAAEAQPAAAGGTATKTAAATDAHNDDSMAAGDDSSSSSGDSRLASASELMRQALLLHPGVLRQIVDRAPIKIDAEWARILAHRVFAAVPPPVSNPTLDHLVALYAERDHLLWRAPDAQRLLRDAAAKVTSPGAAAEGELMDWACVRSEAFSSATNDYRHLALADFSDTVSTLPPEDAQALQNGQPPADVGSNGGADGLRDLRGRSALMVFLQTLLPWNNLGEDQTAAIDHAAANDEDDARNNVGQPP
eukprot:SM000110S18885  [mRNA]  locus=s110:149940:151775:+ [translate_table: standard]